jgi:hypothetical protein
MPTVTDHDPTVDRPRLIADGGQPLSRPRDAARRSSSALGSRVRLAMRLAELQTINIPVDSAAPTDVGDRHGSTGVRGTSPSRSASFGSSPLMEGHARRVHRSSFRNLIEGFGLSEGA